MCNHINCNRVGCHGEPKFRHGDVIQRNQWGHQELGVGDRAIVNGPIEWDTKRKVWRYTLYSFPTGKKLSGTWNENFFQQVGAVATPVWVPDYPDALDYMIVAAHIKLKEPEMLSDFIIKNYPVTAEAVVVAKHFGTHLKCPFNQVMLKGKEQDLLNIAKELDNPKPKE